MKISDVADYCQEPPIEPPMPIFIGGRALMGIAKLPPPDTYVGAVNIGSEVVKVV